MEFGRKWSEDKVKESENKKYIEREKKLERYKKEKRKRKENNNYQKLHYIVYYYWYGVFLYNTIICNRRKKQDQKHL